MAAFIYRTDQKAAQDKVIEQIEGETMTVVGVDNDLSDFPALTEEELVQGEIIFETEGNRMTEVQSLTLPEGMPGTFDRQGPELN